VLQRLIREYAPELIIEVGCWLGLSTALLCEESEESEADVFAIDRWDASFLQTELTEQYARDDEAVDILRTTPLLETWQRNLWPHRRRLFPLKMDSVDGLREVARIGAGHGRRTLIYIDGDHRFAAVLADLRACARHFPEAVVVGDDYQWPEVRQAVEEHAREVGGLELRSDPRQNWFTLSPPARESAREGGRAERERERQPEPADDGDARAAPAARQLGERVAFVMGAAAERSLDSK
jgi:hypothetical protein